MSPSEAMETIKDHLTVPCCPDLVQALDYMNTMVNILESGRIDIDD
jgi:hypothetical protein